MDENSKLKKIIDLYVNKGANNTYLHDEMEKMFEASSLEVKEEGHKYLSQKLKEAKDENAKQKKQKRDKWIFALILITILITGTAINLNIGKKNNKNYFYNYSSNGSNTNTTSTHYCQVSGCTNKAEYVIDGTGGKKEYYCYEHYKQMEEFVDTIMK